MSNVQLLELTLYPQKDGMKPKKIAFKKGCLNIIYGNSQTGKSALISIIDYCLGSKETKIPAGTIRNKCKGFSLKLAVDDKILYIARKAEKNNKNSEEIKFYFGANKDKITQELLESIQLSDFKSRMNDLFGITSLNIALNNDYNEDVEKKGQDKKDDRPSYRDIVAFNFQTQNIVANPNCLLYKSDLYIHRQKIRKIFKYIIGAQTAEQLANDVLKESKKKELDKLIYQQEREEFFQNKTLKDSEQTIYKAIEKGLLKPQKINSSDVNEVKRLLTQISSKSIADMKLTKKQDIIISNKIRSVINEMDKLNNELNPLRLETSELKQIIELNNSANEQLNVKIERLSFAEIIKEYCEANPIDSEVLGDVNKLYNNLKDAENKLSLGDSKNKNEYFRLKLLKNKIRINELEKAVNKSNTLKNLLENQNGNTNILDDIYVKIISKAKTNLDKLNNTKNLEQEIKQLEIDIKNLSYDLSAQTKTALSSIIKYANKFLPEFAEFKELSYFSERDLSVYVKNTDDNEDYYLGETGSGSNWVAYHIGTLLGFHTHFIEKQLPVFNFLVFDQPSQVYFPDDVNKKDENENTEQVNQTKKKKNKIISSDTDCTKEMYKKIKEAVVHNKNNDSNGQLQVVILDHAGEATWGELRDETVHVLPKWTEENPLVPNGW